jgi:hypothetical protein
VTVKCISKILLHFFYEKLIPFPGVLSNILAEFLGPSQGPHAKFIDYKIGLSIGYLKWKLGYGFYDKSGYFEKKN